MGGCGAEEAGRRINAFLAVIIFLLVSIIAAMSCWAWQRDVNERLTFSRLEREITAMREKDDRQDELIDAIIRTEAMSGKFDRKE